MKGKDTFLSTRMCFGHFKNKDLFFFFLLLLRVSLEFKLSEKKYKRSEQNWFYFIYKNLSALVFDSFFFIYLFLLLKMMTNKWAN